MNRHAVPNAIAIMPGRPPNSGTDARYFDFDDSVVRIVKWHPSNHGHKACFNELMGSRLGVLMGAPVVRGCVVFLPSESLPKVAYPPQPAEGFHFAATYLPNETFVPEEHFPSIDNHSELAAAAVMLIWFKVGDQFGHNQLLHVRESRLAGAPGFKDRSASLV